MARISVYMTGGIAAYKAVSVVRSLQKAGHEVRVAMTDNSENFVGPATLAALTKWPVLDDLFSPGRQAEIAHIDLMPIFWLRWPRGSGMMPFQPPSWLCTARA